MKRHQFSRRVFLGGAGATIALPFLESLLPRNLWAAPMPPKRFIAYYVPCGINMALWTPPDDGAAFTLTPALKPLAPVRDQLLVLTGLQNLPARPDGPGDHASGTGAFLTATHPFKTDGASIKNGISMDQVAALGIAGKTSFPSLQLGIDGGSSVGGCDSGYSCAYSRNISWASAMDPLPKLVDPQPVFSRLFAGFDPTQTAAEIAKRNRYKTSVLDYALGDITRLQARVGATDKRKLEEHAAGIREIEKRIQDGRGASLCTPGAYPGDPADYPASVKLMSDMMVLAFKCDLTRVISFMLGNGGSNRPYPFLGIPNGHHEISHHMGDPAKLAMLATINVWEVQQLAYLLEELKKVDEGGGLSLLDSTLVFFSSEIEDGNSHAHTNLPILVAGGAGRGIFKTGRHVRYSMSPQPIANLFTSILNGLGVANTSFGMDGTGPLANLT